MNHHNHVVIKSYLLIVFFWKYTRKALYVVQGCQLPDFSLRTQIFCYTVDFPMTFLYELKTTTYFASHHKTTSKHPRIPVFYFILQNILLAQTKKREERPFTAGTSCAWAGLWPAAMRMLSTSRRFQTFLRHNVGNTDVLCNYIW